MSIISNAVLESAKSAVVGYKITKGNFMKSSPNLPMRIAILSEANTAKQSGLSLDPFETSNLSDVADKLGAGSPAYSAMRILYPLSGGGLGGIPVVVYPVASAVGATAGSATVTITGTATGNNTHSLIISGRDGVDGQFYNVDVVTGDTPTVIAAKYAVAINAVYGSNVSATSDAGVVTVTSKYKGISSSFGIYAFVNNNAAGVSYAVVKTDGTGAPAVADALAKFENDWNTIVLNPYGKDSTVLAALETANGKPDPVNPTGRWAGIVFKPFVALFSYATTTPVADIDVSSKASECTNAYVPAPNMELLPIEVVANAAAIMAVIAQNSPNLDYINQNYPDAVLKSASIGSYSSYAYRDQAIKAGLSTVNLVGGEVSIIDMVTTYNPTSEATPQFKYVRNLFLDWNVRYAYYLLEQAFVVGHTLIPDGQTSSVDKTVSPSQWKGILYKMFEDLADRGLIADVDFSKNSLTVGISSTNPDRFETFFRYKRTGIARICSTTAEAGFYYGGN